MTARTVIITGASDGIGAVAARQLAARGDHVVIVGRSPDKTHAVASQLRADAFVADFARLDDVRDLATALLERYPRIDVLANNAGGILGRREITVDGNEKTFQVNHLAPFLLTNLLLDRLADSRATVINTSSVANSRFARFDIDDLNAERGYSENRAYGNAKLANILFTTELHKRTFDRGISTAAFHPGIVATNFATGSTSLLRLVYRSLSRAQTRSSGSRPPSRGSTGCLGRTTTSGRSPARIRRRTTATWPHGCGTSAPSWSARPSTRADPAGGCGQTDAQRVTSQR